jgi:tight adherence protein B
MPVWLLVAFFFLFAVVLVAVALGLKFIEDLRKRQVTGMIKTVSGEPEIPATTILVEPGNGPTLASLLEKSPVTRILQASIQQAGLEWKASQLLVAMVGLGVTAAFIGLLWNFLENRTLSALVLGLLFASMPYFYVRSKRKARLREVEAQFPDALDFLSRSMRAGHAFSVSLEMLADQSADPLATEIRRVFNEQNLGATVDTALKNLALRVPLIDVGFFVSAVMLQKETGGNLSEILTKLAYVIRERFRLRGRVRAVSSHGRLTGLILTVMPVVLILLLTVVNPGYLKLLVKDPDGRMMIVAAVFGQALGYLFIRKIVNIKV